MLAAIGRIGALARLVLLDGVRRYALLGLVALALAVELSGLFFFAFVPRDIGLVATDFIVSAGWATGMIFLFFHAVQVMSWGENRRVIHTLLAHPISRTEYVLGVFGGLLLLLLLLDGLLAGLGYGVLLLIKSWVSAAYFAQLGLAAYVLSWAGVLATQVLLLAVIVLFSGMLRGTFTVLLVSLAYYLICNGLPVALEFFKQGAPLMRNFLRGLTLIFPNFSTYDYKGLIVATGSLPPFTALVQQLVFVLLYAVLVLTVAAGIYNRRDLK
jgi:ABC-type transport system involved in multi-copper enzyme maturation permease subunit